jgi:hypothetical protein
MIYFTTLLLSVSLTMILVRSKLTESFRQWVVSWSNPNKVSFGYLANCPQCSGVWVGLFAALCCVPHLAYTMSMSGLVHFVAVIAFGTSLCALLVDTYLFQ